MHRLGDVREVVQGQPEAVPGGTALLGREDRGFPSGWKVTQPRSPMDSTTYFPQFLRAVLSSSPCQFFFVSGS